MKLLRRRPSPAMVLASIALVLALTGAAIAGPHAISSALNRSAVKKISKKQADAQITKRAPGLAVASAGSASPAVFAQVSTNGTVNPANSKGITQANLINTGPITGYYCFGNLPFVPRGGTANLDWNGLGSIDALAVVGFGDAAASCPAATQFFVDVRKPDGTGSEPGGFFVALYR